MADISKHIRDLYKDSAELSDLVGILQELVDRIEALEAQQKAAFKLGRNQALEEAKLACGEVEKHPSLGARHCIEAIESLKDNTP